MRKTEQGLTIVEVLVAALILVVGALATFGSLSAATKNTERAKASQVALDRAQQEMEALHSLTNKELAMTAMPSTSSDPLDPGYRVNSGSGTFALTREPPGNYGKLAVNGGELYGGSENEKVIEGGVVNPGPVSFTSGNVSGKVYRYIVWRNDASCPEATCPGSQDFKEIVVAVKLDTPSNQSGERGYVEVQSDFVDPTASIASNPVAGKNGVVTAQQFFLSDTSCAAAGSTTRAEITGDHLLHNTRGTCFNGLQTGGTKGAPDALLLGAPPDTDPEDPTNPPVHDYSNDSYLEPTPNTDKGLQIIRDATVGCHYEPTGTTYPQSQIHRWVTDPMESNFTLTGKVTIEFYTETLNNQLYTGKLCVYLYKRHEVGSPPVATDTMLTNKKGGAGYWEFSAPKENGGYWPKGEWTKERLPMEFSGAPYTIPAGDRLGVALSVERGGTPADSDPILIMYDHPNYPTRIEVDTNTPIEGG